MALSGLFLWGSGAKAPFRMEPKLFFRRDTWKLEWVRRVPLSSLPVPLLGASFCDEVLHREDVADRRMQAVMDAGWVVWEKHIE
jgi:hypothetical protein